MRILTVLPLNDTQKQRIRAAAPDFEHRFATPQGVTCEDVLWADAVLGNVPTAWICQNKTLQWFQSNFAGPDAYLVPGVLPPACLVTNATGAYGLAVGEWLLGMWLALAKDLLLYRDRQRAGVWQPIDRPVQSAAGANVLCVGMGDIGSSFARRAHALGAQVVGVRRHAGECPPYCVRVVAREKLDEELPAADVIALSLPATAETKQLFNAARLARCKRGAILLNVGRGTTVDSDALAAAIQNGPLYGAALDVTDPEPLPPDHPLWKLDTVLITPHISGRFSLPQTLENIVDIFCHNLRLFAAGKTPDNQVSRETHYVSADMPGKRLLCEE